MSAIFLTSTGLSNAITREEILAETGDIKQKAVAIITTADDKKSFPRNYFVVFATRVQTLMCLNSGCKLNCKLNIFLKNNKGEVLGLKGARGGAYDGFYDLPGGRIDIDEFEVPFENIIRRELQEEIGHVDFDLILKPVALGRNENPIKMAILEGAKMYLYGAKRK